MIMQTVQLKMGPVLQVEQRQLIEKTTRLFGEAFTRFDVDVIADRLSEDVIYESQAVLEPLRGKSEVLAYLQKRWAFFAANMADSIVITLGVVDLPKGQDYPCLILQRGKIRDALMTLSIDGEMLIERIDILSALPHPDQAQRIAADNEQ